MNNFKEMKMSDVTFKKHYYVNHDGVPMVTQETISSWEDIMEATVS